MKSLCLLALLAFAATSAFAAEAHFDRTLNIAPGTSLTVSTGAGYIHVTPGSGNQIHISAQVHSHGSWLGDGDAEAHVKQVAANPPIHQSGSGVTVGDTNHAFPDLFHDIVIDYDIQAPRGTMVRASTGSGDIQLEDPGPDSAMNTGSGAIRVNNLHGGASFHTGSGDIQLQQASPGDVQAQTGSGSIRINGFSGGLQAKTGSGDIQVEGRPTAEWALHTGSGSIRLGVGHDAHATIDADTGSGTVRVSQQATLSEVSSNRHHFHGSINGGGALVKAGTGSGDVEVH